MGGMGTWLAAMMAPLVSRVLVSLGMSVVSVVGVTAALSTLKSIFVANLMLAPAAGLQMALLGGLGEGLGLITGAITFRMLLWQVGQSRRILGT